jgi:hypothetical protein
MVSNRVGVCALFRTRKTARFLSYKSKVFLIAI